MTKEKILKITFSCGHTEEILFSELRDMPFREQCMSCLDLYEINDQKQLKLEIKL